jgi:hypothetical protein
MQEVAQTLERNAREVQYGSVSVELRIHEGKVVKTVYRTAKTTLAHGQAQEKNMEVPDDTDSGF